jgi:hypothetical protein
LRSTFDARRAKIAAQREDALARLAALDADRASLALAAAEGSNGAGAKLAAVDIEVAALRNAADHSMVALIALDAAEADGLASETERLHKASEHRLRELQKVMTLSITNILSTGDKLGDQVEAFQAAALEAQRLALQLDLPFRESGSIVMTFGGIACLLHSRLQPLAGHGGVPVIRPKAVELARGWLGLEKATP